jgi:hypothetical protein
MSSGPVAVAVPKAMDRECLSQQVGQHGAPCRPCSASSPGITASSDAPGSCIEYHDQQAPLMPGQQAVLLLLPQQHRAHTRLQC